MNWLKKKVIQWVREDWAQIATVGGTKAHGSRDVEAGMCENMPILNFRVFPAVGGQVVEFTHYDRKTDRSDTTTYIIRKEDDFGDKIAKIANLEMLK